MCASNDINDLRVEDVVGITVIREHTHAFPTHHDHRQDSKGTWWMPWHLEAMKDVDDCDKPR
jgi:hypothetical protein